MRKNIGAFCFVLLATLAGTAVAQDLKKIRVAYPSLAFTQVSGSCRGWALLS